MKSRAWVLSKGANVERPTITPPPSPKNKKACLTILVYGDGGWQY